MKGTFAVCCVMVSCLASPSFAADNAAANFGFTGTAKPVCHMPSAQIGSTNNASFDGQKISVADLLDENTAMVKASEIVISYPGTMCNWAATVTIKSVNGGMIRTSGTDAAVTGSGEFADKVHYRVSVNWGSISINNFDTAMLSGDFKIAKETGGANFADFTVTVSTVAGSIPVLNGTYSDTIIINVGNAI